NKRNLKTTHSNIAISTDNTKVQQEHFRRVRAELEQRKIKGERNLFIKYVYGTPTIAVSKNVN
ncbi:hypothetical protein PPYR_04511, partial [Photinus pyralis]